MKNQSRRFATNIASRIIQSNSDGSIDVNGDVNISEKKLKKLPLRFNHVSGNFYCSYNRLTTLKDSPKSVGGDFDCRGNLFIPSEMRWALIPMARGKIEKVIFDNGKIDNIIE